MSMLNIKQTNTIPYEKDTVTVAYSDFAKTFDKVSDVKLIHKLSQLGISSALLS